MSARKKRLGLSLSQILAQLDAKGGKLMLDLPKGKGKDRLRICVSCRRADVPACWSLAVMWNGPAIDVVDYHVTEYVDDAGCRRKGWHRDERVLGNTVKKVTLQDFNPATVSEFILESCKLFNVVLEPEGGSRRGQQMRIAEGNDCEVLD